MYCLSIDQYVSEFQISMRGGKFACFIYRLYIQFGLAYGYMSGLVVIHTGGYGLTCLMALNLCSLVVNQHTKVEWYFGLLGIES